MVSLSVVSELLRELHVRVCAVEPDDAHCKMDRRNASSIDKSRHRVYLAILDFDNLSFRLLVVFTVLFFLLLMMTFLSAVLFTLGRLKLLVLILGILKFCAVVFVETGRALLLSDHSEELIKVYGAAAVAVRLHHHDFDIFVSEFYAAAETRK